MTALTLRLEPGLARTLDQFCKETGHQKNGLIKTLIRRFLDQQKKKVGAATSPKNIQSLVGIVRLGGDAAREENYFE